MAFWLGYRAEFLAFLFGVLLILVTFGDDHISVFTGIPTGNLDTIFGHRLWPVMDVVYPLATLVVFVLYGWVTGRGLKINTATVLVFLSFVLVLGLFNIDDLVIVLGKVGIQVPINPSQGYWAAMSLIYPLYGTLTFFGFGKLNENKHPKG